MIDTLSAVTRERLRRFMRIVRMAVVIGAGVGAVYGVAIAGPGARALLVSLLISIPIGVVAALLTASCIAGIEILLLPRASMRWLDALPFAAVFTTTLARWRCADGSSPSMRCASNMRTGAPARLDPREFASIRRSCG